MESPTASTHLRAHRALLAVLPVVVLLFAPSASFARTESASYGSVRAILSYERDPAAPDAWLTIERDGSEIFYEPLVFETECVADRCWPAGLAGGNLASLFVRQLDSTPDPEVVIQAFAGGVSCCFIAQVWRVREDYAEPVIERSFGKQGFRLRDEDGDGVHEFWSQDRRFAYRYASGASSALPLRIFTFRDGRFADVTLDYPEAIAADARRWWRIYERRGRRSYEVLAVMASWVASQYRLGRAAYARRVVLRETRRRHLPSRTPTGRRFYRDLTRFLSQAGY